MEFFFFFQTLFGMCLCIQSSESLWRNHSFHLHLLIVFGMISLILNAVLLLFFSPSFLFFSIACHLPPLLLILFEKGLRFWREKNFKRQFSSFLDEVLLQMRAGKAFRMAIQVSGQGKSKIFQKRMKDIMNVVFFSQDRDFSSYSSFVSRILIEFKKVASAPHHSMQRLSDFRTKLKFEESFERQTKRILSHIYAQSGFLSVFYILLFLFSLWRYGYKSNLSLLFFSFLLFVSGILILFFIGKKKKWKV